MSLVHLIYIGHFEHEGELVRFWNTPSNRILKPAVSQPLDMTVVKRAAEEIGGLEIDTVLPSEWSLWMEDDHLVGSRYELNELALEFLARLVELTSCEIAELNSRSTVQLDELRPRLRKAGP